MRGTLGGGTRLWRTESWGGGWESPAASGFYGLPETQAAPLSFNAEDTPGLHYSIAATENKAGGGGAGSSRRGVGTEETCVCGFLCKVK